MKLTIRNRTAYRFDRPVFLEPHIIRLRPRIDAAVWPLTIQLAIEPAPTMRAEYLDLEGNVVTQAWFSGTTEHLRIDSQSTVETHLTDPFRFLLDDPGRRLPEPYPTELMDRLQAYRTAPDSVSREVRTFALAVAEEVVRRPERFPGTLADRLHQECKLEIRREGTPKSAEDTLAEKRGACRDLAVLFNECCRSLGLAARFVSGYAHVDGSDDHELHAWSEVYLPGGGWRGYDPTHGLAVADRHVVVAAAAEPADAAPVSGSYRGSVNATLETTVEVTEAS